MVFYVILGFIILGALLVLGVLLKQSEPTASSLKEPSHPDALTQDIYKKRISELEKELLVSFQKVETQKAQTQQTISDLSKENEALKNQIESLQNESIKIKAQSAGYERVSFNYKNQLEDLLKK